MSRSNLYGPFAFHGELVTDVRLLGRRLDAFVSPSHEQVSTRIRNGLTAPLRDRDILSALFELPRGFPIAWESLDPVLAVAIDSMPNGLVRRTDRTVERLYEPPMGVRSLVTTADSWQQVIDRLGVLAPDAPRAAVLRRRPRQLLRVAEEAHELGIGLLLSSGELISAPTRQFLRHGVHAWLISEELFGVWLSARLDGAPVH